MIWILFGCIIHTSKNIHIWPKKWGRMSESSLRFWAYHFNLINPFHIFNIQNVNLVIVGFILKILRTKVSSKKNHKTLVDYTWLFLYFLRILSFNVWYSSPFLFRYIKWVIILQDCGIVSSKNNQFIAIIDHVMKSTTFRKCFFVSCWSQKHVNFCQRIVVLAPTKSWLNF